MLEESKIAADLLDAYRATRYWVNAVAEPFFLQVGQPSPEMLSLYAAAPQRCAAFLTACNPYSEQLSAEANRAAHECLLEVLDALAVQTFEGAGRDPVGVWPEERSVLVLGLGLDAARSIGDQFNQNAVIWAAADAVPRLIVLR